MSEKDLVAGFPTYWSRTGQGRRKALFIHCSLAHSGAWKGVQALLAPHLEMTGFDLPGHGQSGDWDRRGDYQTVTAGIAAALIDAPSDLIAHSYGATVALRLARDHPDLVRSLTLVEPVLFAAARHLPAYDEHREAIAPFAAALAAGDDEKAARVFNRFWGNGVAWDKLPATLRAAMTRRIRLIGEGAAVTDDDIHNQAAPGALEAIRQPVLLIEGALSPPIIAAVHDVFAARLRDVHRVVVAGAGHMVPVTHAQAVAHEIAAFLKL